MSGRITRLASTLTAFALTGAFVVAGVTQSAAAPKDPAPSERQPVTPTVATVPATGLAARSAPPGAPPGTVVLAQAERAGGPVFHLFGAEWQSRSDGVKLQGRTRNGAGDWSSWVDLEAEEGGDGPEASKDSRVAAPYWSGEATSVEVRAVGAPDASIQGLQAVLVTTSATPEDASLLGISARSTVSGVPQPSIISRAAWGADESLLNRNGADCVPPKYDQTVKAAVIHHTEGSNSYTAAQSASIVRGIYSYHVVSRGWCDIGYNFLIDKYGQIFEGRHGGITMPVHGAHATLWNTNTVGVSFMMNSMTEAPTQASLNASYELLAWKLGSNYRNPQGTTTLVGKTQPVIFGHGDVMPTDCPGTHIRAHLPQLRVNVAATMRGNEKTPLYELWASQGGDNGPLGPVHELERNLANGRTVGFVKGSGWMRPDRQVFWLGEQLTAQYLKAGGPTGTLGWPTSSQRTIAPGVYQATFSNGTTLTWPTEPPAVGFAGPATYTPVAPARLMDTRASGSMSPNGTVAMPVAGQATIPPDAVAAVLNVTVTNPRSGGYLSAYPTGVAQPNVSNLNFVPGQTVPNLVTVKLGSQGRVTFLNASGGASDVVVDVAGYYTAKPPSNGGAMVALNPTRILDTRGRAQIPAGGEQDLKVTGSGVTNDARAAMLNLTVISPAQGGYLSAYPAEQKAPNASNVNFVPGQTAANLSVVKVSADGKVRLRNASSAPIDVAVDVTGYVSGSGAGGGFRAADTPVRVLDSREGNGLTQVVGPNSSFTLKVRGRAGVPADQGSAMVLNLTATQAQASGYITVYPTGGAAPATSNLNLVPGRTVSNQVVVKVGADGTITFRNTSPGAVHLIADLQGYVV